MATGLFVALIGGILYTVFNTNFSPFTIPMMIGYMIMAVIASLFSYVNITVLGILTNLIHNAFVFLVYHFLFNYDIRKNLMFSLSNLLFNVILFLNIAPFLYGVMA